MQIILAAIDDLHDLARLFDGYRQFYGQPSDIPLAGSFLQERLNRADSTIFIARDETGQPLGFTQLYPSFTSVRCARIYILNDLFVTVEARGRGVGRALLAAAADFARQAGAVRLTLSTGVENRRAQGVYEDAGWTRDNAFFVYNLPL